MADVEAGYLSSEAAREIYFVIHDPATLAVDTAGTEAARAAERQARLCRGRPYTEFVELWATPEPPPHLPYYGSWGGDNGIIHATAWTTHGPVRVAAPADRSRRSSCPTRTSSPWPCSRPGSPSWRRA